MSLKEEEFKKILICLKEIDYFLKTDEGRFIVNNLATHLSLKSTSQVNN